MNLSAGEEQCPFEVVVKKHESSQLLIQPLRLPEERDSVKERNPREKEWERVRESGREWERVGESAALHRLR